MMNGRLRSRKFRYGSVAVAMTALIVAVVIMMNAGLSLLSEKYGWYTDMTHKNMYSLTDAAVELLDTNINQTISDREASNAVLPQTNFATAEDNLKRMQESLALAQTNIDRASKNVDLAGRNRELLFKSVSVAEDNLEIALDNLALAEEVYEFVLEKEGESSVNVAAAAATVELAKKNVELAEKNVETAAKNRLSTSGITALDELTQLEQLGAYKYYGAYARYVNDTDSITAAENLTIANNNKNIAAENVTIAQQNVETARKNMTSGVTPDDAGYTAPAEYREYEAFKSFETYTYLGTAETPRAYESYLNAAADAVRQGEVKVNIIFCDDRDALMENTAQRYVLETAEDLERAFPGLITVSYVNIWTNPGAVQKYKSSTLTNIYSSNVIIESGTEFRVYTLNSFFVFNDTSSTDPWSYNGEKKFAAGILAVIKAESPIACVTINHGEMFTDYELFSLLQDAGYLVQTIDLANQDIPEDCRLMVVCNPTSDFLVKDGISDVSEIAKLNTWLDELNTLMVFMSPDSPVLPNFEEYLEEWGVKYDRHTDESGAIYPYMIKDSTQSLTADGMTLIGEYTTKGLGASLHEEMRSVGVPAKVVFKNSMSISYSDTYQVVDHTNEEDATDTFRYGTYYSNGVSRSIYDVFTSSPNAVALANGEQVKSATNLEPFKLMTVTRETQMVSNQDADYSYVIACASTDFISADMLQSIVYGNSDLLGSTLRAVGRETVVVDLAHKPFDKTQIETLTISQANQYTVILTVVPALIVVILGVFVVVRRKYA